MINFSTSRNNDRYIKYLNSTILPVPIPRNTIKEKHDAVLLLFKKNIDHLYIHVVSKKCVNIFFG